MHNQLSGAQCRTERGGVCGEKRLHFGGSHHSSSFFLFSVLYSSSFSEYRAYWRRPRVLTGSPLKSLETSAELPVVIPVEKRNKQDRRPQKIDEKRNTRGTSSSDPARSGIEKSRHHKLGAFSRGKNCFCFICFRAQTRGPEKVEKPEEKRNYRVELL